MQSQELASLESRLLDPLPIPVIGQCLQKRAVTALAEDRSSEAARLLAKAVTRLKEPEIKASILDALGKLRNQNCIDGVCEVWADTRHRDLANLLVKKSWVASMPVELRVITALKVGQPQVIINGSKEVVEPLLNAFKDRDTEIANRASECAIIFDKPEYQESLCRLVIEQDHPIARQVAIKAQYAPSEPSQKALFYFLSEQWDKYETLDYEHSLLEKVYELGNEKLRKKIAEKVKQSGRTEWVQIIAGGRKGQRLEKMTDAEWEATLDILSSNKQWEEMWRLAQKAPAIWSKQLLHRLKQVSWMPLVQEERAGFERLAQLADKFPGITISSTSCHKSLTNPDGSWVKEGISFSPDGQLFASCSDYYVSLWQMPQGKHLTILPAPDGVLLRGISFSPDGQILASCTSDETIRLWQIPDGKHLATLDGHTERVYEISFSPDGQILASCSRDETIRLWQIPDGEHFATLNGHTSIIIGISFSPDGQILASCSRDETIRLWQIPDGKHLATLNDHTDKISFSPDGQILASCSSDKTIRLWRMPDGEHLTTLNGHTEEVFKISFSPDGQILASCSSDKTIRLWRMPDGEHLTTLNGHTEEVFKISFSPDGQILASCSHDKTIRLWRMPDGEHLATLTDYYSWVEEISFSPDGQCFAEYDNGSSTIRLWSPFIFQLSRLPVRELSLHNREQIEKLLQNSEISEREQNSLKFMQALINWYRRFDVEVENAPQLVSTGEFDIEIEG